MTVQTEFSRLFQVENLKDEGTEIDVTANADECKKLAERCGLISLVKLDAKLRVKTLPGSDIIEVQGNVQSVIAQTCVVTLEEFTSPLDFTFTALFQDAETLEKVESEEVDEMDEMVEEPDPIDNGEIDMGELVAQQLILHLDAYPRKPGAKIDPRYSGEEAMRENPFDSLKGMLKTPSSN